MLAVGRWSLQLAPGWEGELEDGCACIAKEDGAGELPGDADVGPTRMGDFEGLHATYVEDGQRWQRFYLSYGRLLLLISYTVDLADEGAEDDEVIAMLRSLRAKGDRWE